MKIAIGLPNAIPQTPGSVFTDWAREAESHGFSSLGSIGRTVFDSHEELIVFAAAAAVTTKIGLCSSVLIAPSRDPVLLAKQAATIDAISGGRFTLGVGIGWRDDEFVAAGCPERFKQRGKLMEEHLATYRTVWNQEHLSGFSTPVGPKANPGLVLSGAAEPAVRRAGALSDGFFAAPANREDCLRMFGWVQDEWSKANRAGKPRLIAARYFAIGEDAQAEAEFAMKAYYERAGAEFTQVMLGWMMRTPEDVQKAIEEMKASGADELDFWPATHRLDQIKRLATAAGLR